MCWILFICKGPTSFIESINQSGSPKKSICWYGTQKLPKILTFIFITIPNRNSYFPSYKAWKINYDMQLFVFLKTNISCCIFNFSWPACYKNESIHLNSGTIVIWNRKMVWKHRSYLLIFLLKLEIFGMSVQRIHHSSKKWKLLWGMT